MFENILPDLPENLAQMSSEDQLDVFLDAVSKNPKLQEQIDSSSYEELMSLFDNFISEATAPQEPDDGLFDLLASMNLIDARPEIKPIIHKQKRKPVPVASCTDFDIQLSDIDKQYATERLEYITEQEVHDEPLSYVWLSCDFRDEGFKKYIHSWLFSLDKDFNEPIRYLDELQELIDLDNNYLELYNQRAVFLCNRVDSSSLPGLADKSPEKKAGTIISEVLDTVVSSPEDLQAALDTPIPIPVSESTIQSKCEVPEAMLAEPDIDLDSVPDTSDNTSLELISDGDSDEDLFTDDGSDEDSDEDLFTDGDSDEDLFTDDGSDEDSDEDLFTDTDPEDESDEDLFTDDGSDEDSDEELYGDSNIEEDSDEEFYADSDEDNLVEENLAGTSDEELYENPDEEQQADDEFFEDSDEEQQTDEEFFEDSDDDEPLEDDTSSEDSEDFEAESEEFFGSEDNSDEEWGTDDTSDEDVFLGLDDNSDDEDDYELEPGNNYPDDEDFFNSDDEEELEPGNNSSDDENFFNSDDEEELEPGNNYSDDDFFADSDDDFFSSDDNSDDDDESLAEFLGISDPDAELYADLDDKDPYSPENAVAHLDDMLANAPVVPLTKNEEAANTVLDIYNKLHSAPSAFKKLLGGVFKED